MVADLDLAMLDRARKHGSVQAFLDSRSDTLHTQFDGEVRTVARHLVLPAPPGPA